jgi:hypothetical protein
VKTFLNLQDFTFMMKGEKVDKHLQFNLLYSTMHFNKIIIRSSIIKRFSLPLHLFPHLLTTRLHEAPKNKHEEILRIKVSSMQHHDNLCVWLTVLNCPITFSCFRSLAFLLMLNAGCLKTIAII